MNGEPHRRPTRSSDADEVMHTQRMSVSYSVIRDNVIAVVLDGILDSATYLLARNAIIKAAVEQPDLVVVQLDRIEVPAESALAAFTSARWHVADWPGVQIILVASEAAMRNTLVRNGITRSIRCTATFDGALARLGEVPSRRRADYAFEPGVPPAGRARRFVARTLADWSRTAYADSMPMVRISRAPITFSPASAMHGVPANWACSARPWSPSTAPSSRR